MCVCVYVCGMCMCVLYDVCVEYVCVMYVGYMYGDVV